MQSEDGVSFLSAVIGALGSTMIQQPGSPTIFVGLVLAAVSKALPSFFTDPKDRVEDLALFIAALASALASGLQSNWTFSNPSVWVYALLLLGMLIKTGMSLRKKKPKDKRKPEDVLAFIVAAVTLAFVLYPGTSQFASGGLFLSFHAQTLTSSTQ